MTQVEMVKAKLARTFQLFNELEEAGLTNKKGELTDILIADTVKMVLYFTASDGTVSASEKDLINEVFGTNLSVQDCVDMIKKGNIYSTDFERSEVYTLAVVKALDERQGRGVEDGVTKIVLEVFMDVAKLFITADGDVANQEVEDFKIYFTNLAKKYL